MTSLFLESKSKSRLISQIYMYQFLHLLSSRSRFREHQCFFFLNSILRNEDEDPDIWRVRSELSFLRHVHEIIQIFAKSQYWLCTELQNVTIIIVSENEDVKELLVFWYECYLDDSWYHLLIIWRYVLEDEDLDLDIKYVTLAKNYCQSGSWDLRTQRRVVTLTMRFHVNIHRALINRSLSVIFLSIISKSLWFTHDCISVSYALGYSFQSSFVVSTL